VVKRLAMAISLSTETQQRLEEVLKNGPYRSADDVVSAALDALNELETPSLDERSLDAIDRAEAQIERGEVHDWNGVRDQVRAKFLGE
jgi:Arc/MetJ-type ribon-helix-helix transcriptional regulator